jgi:uncharacterized protein (DUF305 family)
MSDEVRDDVTDGGPSLPAMRAVVLVAALVLLGAAVGYLIGVRGSRVASSGVDIGFMVDMSDHHDQAVQLAILELSNGQDPIVKGFARDVLLFQRSELGEMGVLLADHDAARPEYDLQRTVMGWMEMPTELQSMPGLASEDDLARLGAARGAEADLLFLSLMSAHHEGGVHMAQFAAEHAADPRVRELAGRMARYQSVEIREYSMVRDRLSGVQSSDGDSSADPMHDMPGMDH